jgi:hypothetical protein
MITASLLTPGMACCLFEDENPFNTKYMSLYPMMWTDSHNL